jgi:lipopolysaccharide transport system ATP-binding protein
MSSETPQPRLTGTATEEPPVIEVRNLVKEYRLGALEGVKTLAKRLLGQPVPPRQRFRALDDVSFSIRRGEVVGIIGHNGAGKSTLLKMLCNITTPTSGSVTVRGRVAPLIEVGAGLVGDMTGRENIYLNASILGLTRAEIEDRIDEIIDFAELKEFIDTPIKRYSSGMQIKLGFAIATAVDANILLIDEVLAVGDIAFQRKCFERLDALVKDASRTILVVGHNIRQLERICSRIVWLARGSIAGEGAPTRIANAYVEAMQTTSPRQPSTPLFAERHQDTAEIVGATVRAPSTEGRVLMHQELTIILHLRVHQPLVGFEVIAGIHTPDLTYICLSSSIDSTRSSTLETGEHWASLTIHDNVLRPGPYEIGAGLYDHNGRAIWRADRIARFDVSAVGFDVTKRPSVGIVDLPTAWNISNGIAASASRSQDQSRPFQISSTP